MRGRCVADALRELRSRCRTQSRTFVIHRDEINAGVKAALGKLNGTDAAAIAMMTGLSAEELDDLGGLPK